MRTSCISQVQIGPWRIFWLMFRILLPLVWVCLFCSRWFVVFVFGFCGSLVVLLCVSWPGWGCFGCWLLALLFCLFLLFVFLSITDSSALSVQKRTEICILAQVVTEPPCPFSQNITEAPDLPINCMPCCSVLFGVGLGSWVAWDFALCQLMLVNEVRTAALNILSFARVCQAWVASLPCLCSSLCQCTMVSHYSNLINTPMY